MAGVRFEHVVKRFGDNEVVRDLNLIIPDKEFLVLVGPSGSGKSTVLRLLAGLEEITSGSIYIGDRLVNNVQPKDRDIAMVFQSYALYPHMSVYDNMAFALSLHKTPKTEIQERVNHAAGILGITELLKRKPRQLSGGQRQRVALGRAIVREPLVFLLDEPLSNLDAKLRVQTRAEISKLHMRLGTTFVYVTHDQVEAMTMATRIAVLNLGMLQQVGTPQELYDTPGNIFVAGFIGSPSMNFFDANVIENKEKVCCLETQGFRVPVPPQKGEKLERYMGKKVVMGVRPEDIYNAKFIPSGIAASPVDADIDVVEMMGSEVYLHLISAGRPFLARVDPRTRSRAGEKIEVVFNMNNMHAFDSETGDAIVH